VVKAFEVRALLAQLEEPHREAPSRVAAGSPRNSVRGVGAILCGMERGIVREEKSRLVRLQVGCFRPWSSGNRAEALVHYPRCAGCSCRREKELTARDGALSPAARDGRRSRRPRSDVHCHPRSSGVDTIVDTTPAARDSPPKGTFSPLARAPWSAGLVSPERDGIYLVSTATPSPHSVTW
jgi:hypothetical protein